MVREDVVAALLQHPQVRDCAVVSIPTGQDGDTVVAYVETDDAEAEQVRAFLSESGLPESSIPGAVVPMRSLPRTASGQVDRAALPLPPLPAAMVGKTGLVDGLDWRPFAVIAITVGCALAAWLLTDHLWPGSTALGWVPSPWAGLFRGLYVAECLSFGAGVAFLFLGWAPLVRVGRPLEWTRPAYVAIVWLLVAWWPQDNLYRLTYKDDWPRQAALVYGFNITLMLAAAVLAVFAVSGRRQD